MFNFSREIELTKYAILSITTIPSVFKKEHSIFISGPYCIFVRNIIVYYICNLCFVKSIFLSYHITFFLDKECHFLFSLSTDFFI